MPPEQDVRAVAVRELLDGLSQQDVAVLCIEALRRWRASAPNETALSMHGSLGLHLVPLLAERKGTRADARQLKEPFLYSLAEPWMDPIVEFVWWLVRAGLAAPHLNASTGYPTSMRLLPAGRRLLDAKDDHPLLPAFVDRARARCPGLTEAVVAHLSDAQSCLRNGLLRPAVVLSGLAYEAAIEEVARCLVDRKQLAPGALELKAAKRLVLVKSAISSVLSGSSLDDRFTAHAACDFADTLRRRRNDASHTTPTFGFEDHAEIEELLISAGRHLPGLWLLVL